MLFWMLFNAINQNHPAPAVPQPFILLLLMPEVPFLGDLVKHRGDWVRVCECLT